MGNIKVNTEKLAAGILEMIEEHPDSACLSLGMLPSEVMECFEKNLTLELPGEKHKETRREIVHNVTCEILKLATQKGICIV